VSGSRSAEPGLGQRLEAVVRGRVQGVGYRVFVQREAARLGLTGWVRNRDDGAVDLVAEGGEPALRALLARLREGPPAARVAGVEARWSPPTREFSRFGIRSGGHAGD
jgi:acylphosphatase